MPFCYQRLNPKISVLALKTHKGQNLAELDPVKSNMLLRRAERGKGERGGRASERAREEEGLEGVMLQRGARGAVRLGKMYVFPSPVSPAAVGERGGNQCKGKEGKMNGKKVGGNATETYARDNLPIYQSPKANCTVRLGCNTCARIDRPSNVFIPGINKSH